MTPENAQMMARLRREVPELAADITRPPTESQKRHRDRNIEWKRANAKILSQMQRGVYTIGAFADMRRMP